MDERDLCIDVRDHVGLRTIAEARRATRAALAALRCALRDDDARAVAKALPAAFARELVLPPQGVARDAQSLYLAADRREHVGIGFATEHLQGVLEVLARRLDPEIAGRLRKHLPPDVAALLHAREPAGETPPYVHEHPAHAPAPLQTLSRARPGTAEPIADARHELAHAASVARSSAPHAERMVETSRSPVPGTEDGSLATARGATDRR